MKTKVLLIAASFLLCSQGSFADDNQCQKAYGQAVAYCAHSLDSLPPNMRAGAQKACVQEAKVAKDYCMSGISVCLDACQASYNTNVVTCQATYDPSTCGANLICQQIVTQQQSDCVSAAVNTLNSCNASCQL